MSKKKDYETLYAVRDKKTKKIARGTKCKGGSFYKQKNMCQQRCDNMNKAYRSFENDIEKLQGIEYEVGEYAVVDIEKYRELIGDQP